MNFKLPFIVLTLSYVASPSMGQGKVCFIPRIQYKLNRSNFKVGSSMSTVNVPSPKQDLNDINGKPKMDQSTSIMVTLYLIVPNSYLMIFQIVKTKSYLKRHVLDNLWVWHLD